MAEPPGAPPSLFIPSSYVPQNTGTFHSVAGYSGRRVRHCENPSTPAAWGDTPFCGAHAGDRARGWGARTPGCPNPVSGTERCWARLQPRGRPVPGQHAPRPGQGTSLLGRPPGPRALLPSSPPWAPCSRTAPLLLRPRQPRKALSRTKTALTLSSCS